jgi:phosphoglycerate dehydrogenase-like enzyme
MRSSARIRLSANGKKLVELEELPRSRMSSRTQPATPQTVRLFNADRFAQMKWRDFHQHSRGEAVDERR